MTQETSAAELTCKYCGVELIGGACVNMCWLLAGDPNPYAPTPPEGRTE